MEWQNNYILILRSGTTDSGFQIVFHRIILSFQKTHTNHILKKIERLYLSLFLNYGNYKNPRSESQSIHKFHH